MSLFRMKRINELVKCELSGLIRQHLPVEKYGLISVTEVDVAKDLKTANVYISSVGLPQEEKDVIHALNQIRGRLQHELSRRVVVKYTPHLVFKQDHGLERGQHLVELLDSLEQGQKA